MKRETKETDRGSLGKQSGIIGLAGNLVLVLLEAAAGILSNSVAVTADALNNLADCASSVVTLLGFSMSAKGKDYMHPYGHGRMEYVSGFIVSILIMFTGGTAGLNAFKRLLHPQQINVTFLTAAALCIGIAVKCAMAKHIGDLNKKAESPALKAVQKDDISDALVTTATLAGVLVSPYTHLPMDGVLGLLVSVIVLKSGLASFIDNMMLLLGEGADPALEDKIMEIITEYLPPRSIEEIALHDYGPANKLAFIRIDTPAVEEAGQTARLLSCAKEKLMEELEIDATLYWDLTEAAG